MSTFDKLLQRLRSLDKNLRFEELASVLTKYGYQMRFPSGGSSHATFRKKGREPITIPRHRTIDKVYVEIVKRAVESEENNEDD